MSVKLENLFNKGINVYLLSAEKEQKSLALYDQLSDVMDTLINNIYSNEPTKNAVIYTLTEASLNLEHAVFNACTGFYNNSLDSLRKVLELSVFGIYFDNNLMEYQGWLYGHAEYKFGSKLDYVFKVPEINRWASCRSFNLYKLRNEINKLYTLFSQYTHSSPVKWEQDGRITNILEYNGNKFCQCIDLLSSVVKIIVTLLTLYIPSIVDEPFSRIIDAQIWEAITMQGGF